jgi:hypothetical protein
MMPAAVLACFPAGRACAADAPIPLIHAHSHNDNERPRPLLDALEHGFCSVEADVNLIDGQLLVGHEAGATRAGATLEALYLAPLLERVRKNGGRVYPGGPGITLLIDMKTDAAPTYDALRPLLERYAPMLTSYRGGAVEPGAVTVVLSGNNPRLELPSETARYAALDGDVDDLDGKYPASVIPQVSEDWRFQFDWQGTRPLSAKAFAKLKAFVGKAHAQGRRIRFYAAPDNELAWTTLLEAGVDVLNTDRLDAMRDFLLRRMMPAKPAPLAPVLEPFSPAPLPVPD